MSFEILICLHHENGSQVEMLSLYKSPPSPHILNRLGRRKDIHTEFLFGSQRESFRKG